MVKIGNLFFRTRNFIFPIFYLFLFIPSSQLVVNYKIIAIIGISITIIGQLIRMVTIGLVYVIRGVEREEFMLKDWLLMVYFLIVEIQCMLEIF